MSGSLEGVQPYRLFTDTMPIFPPSLDLIEPNLYLGNHYAAADPNTLENYKITHILTIEDRCLPEKITSLKKVKFIQLDDDLMQDLLRCLEQADEFIREALAEGTILVHCYMGVSRSASLVIAHIMKKYNLDYEQAYKKVYEKRSIIRPNASFVYQLKLYKEMGYKLDPNNKEYKSRRLRMATLKMRFCKTLPNELLDVIQPDPALDQSEPRMPQNNSYCCKKCHRILARESNLLTHQNAGEICTTVYLFEPLAWMNVADQIQNTLVCPQCNAEVGFFSWTTEGWKCSCGVKISPAFWLTPTEVDITNI